jgi:hypothetical protein
MDIFIRGIQEYVAALEKYRSVASFEQWNQASGAWNAVGATMGEALNHFSTALGTAENEWR